jgi:hypothetical protein
MQNSSESRESRIAAAGSKGIGLGTVNGPLKPDETLENVPESVDPPTRIQPVSERFPALEKQEVILTFSAPEAKVVNVAGNFNNWRPEATPLKNLDAGEWVVRLMLRSGQYEYRFVVDGRWCDDPEATGRVASPYGGFNSVLLVPLAVRTSIL